MENMVQLFYVSFSWKSVPESGKPKRGKKCPIMQWKVCIKNSTIFKQLLNRKYNLILTKKLLTRQSYVYHVRLHETWFAINYFKTAINQNWVSTNYQWRSCCYCYTQLKPISLPQCPKYWTRPNSNNKWTIFFPFLFFVIATSNRYFAGK